MSGLHGGGGQIGVLILQPSIQRQPPLLSIVVQHGCDGQGALKGAVGLHCLSVENKTPT